MAITIDAHILADVAELGYRLREAGGPVTLSEVAEWFDADEPTLYRILMMAAVLGLLETLPPDLEYSIKASSAYTNFLREVDSVDSTEAADQPVTDAAAPASLIDDGPVQARS